MEKRELSLKFKWWSISIVNLARTDTITYVDNTKVDFPSS